MPLKLYCAIILILHSLLVFPQSEWSLSKDKNGIRVYTSNSTTSKFKSIKVEATVTGTIDKLISIVMDVANNKSWVYNTKQSYLIKKIAANDILYYAVTSLPWPVSNRDMIIRMRYDYDATNKTLKIIATGIPDALPEKEGIVRVKYFSAVWDVKALSDTNMVINYKLSMDPSGSVPAGITNMFIAKGPYETFYNLSNLLKR